MYYHSCWFPTNNNYYCIIKNSNNNLIISDIIVIKENETANFIPSIHPISSNESVQ